MHPGSIRCQRSIDRQSWELIVVDNASAQPVAELVDLSWHPAARVLVEKRLGLTRAQFTGFHAASGEVLLYVDDDNILAPDYLYQVLVVMGQAPKLGAVGGKSLPRYELPPPEWFPALSLDLGCRDLGEAPLVASWRGVEAASRSYPKCTPIGAGMAIRRCAFAPYVSEAEADPFRAGLGRKGCDLASGEDNDIMMSLLTRGWDVAYFPQLRLEHLIPANRLTRDYLGRYAYSANRTWVQVLDIYGISPWESTSALSLPVRKLRAYLTNKAWASDANFIRWRAACGIFDGRSLLRGGRKAMAGGPPFRSATL